MDTPQNPPPSGSKLVWKNIEVRDGAPKANRFRGSSKSAKTENCKAESRRGYNEAVLKGNEGRLATMGAPLLKRFSARDHW